jgi:hypothetical protein
MGAWRFTSAIDFRTARSKQPTSHSTIHPVRWGLFFGPVWDGQGCAVVTGPARLSAEVPTVLPFLGMDFVRSHIPAPHR